MATDHDQCVRAETIREMLSHSLSLKIACVTFWLAQVENKCSDTILVTCENLSDIPRYGKASWEVLVVENDRCKPDYEATLNDNEVLRLGTFNKTPNLEQLFVSRKVTNLEPGAFFGIKRLKYLKMHGNELKVIQRGAFSHLKHLEKLDISHNSIENVVHGFLKDTRLRHVNLAYNKLTNIQVDMFDLSTLEEIILSHNNLAYIAADVFNARTQILDLSYNDLRDLQPNIMKGYDSLRYLLLSHNKLEHFEIVTEGVSSLEILDLSHNEILDLDVTNLQYSMDLEYLYLNNNKLNILSPFCNVNGTEMQCNMVMYLPNLKTMSVRANPWHCDYLNSLFDFVGRHNISKTNCDKQFFSNGKFPVCIVTTIQEWKADKSYRDDVYNRLNSAVSSFNCKE